LGELLNPEEREKFGFMLAVRLLNAGLQQVGKCIQNANGGASTFNRIAGVSPDQNLTITLQHVKLFFPPTIMVGC
jgi:hypothetical protein